jgi:hypothetical protein
MNLGKLLDYNAGKLVHEIACNGYKRATKYLSPTLTIKATRQGKLDKRGRQMTVLVTFGRPNYREREFIKQAKKAGEPFPIKKVQLK